VLTIIATLFMPLSFVAGVYGMNFAWMPGLESRYGYFAVVGIMGLAALGMLYYFHRRRWL
jgi:magnesium transporter